MYCLCLRSAHLFLVIKRLLYSYIHTYMEFSICFSPLLKCFLLSGAFVLCVVMFSYLFLQVCMPSIKFNLNQSYQISHLLCSMFCCCIDCKHIEHLLNIFHAIHLSSVQLDQCVVCGVIIDQFNCFKKSELLSSKRIPQRKSS